MEGQEGVESPWWISKAKQSDTTGGPATRVTTGKLRCRCTDLNAQATDWTAVDDGSFPVLAVRISFLLCLVHRTSPRALAVVSSVKMAEIGNKLPESDPPDSVSSVPRHRSGRLQIKEGCGVEAPAFAKIPRT